MPSMVTGSIVTLPAPVESVSPSRRISTFVPSVTVSVTTLPDTVATAVAERSAPPSPSAWLPEIALLIARAMAEASPNAMAALTLICLSVVAVVPLSGASSNIKARL